MDESRTLALAEALLRMSSVTPNDGGCQQLLAERLKPHGFECEAIVSGSEEFRVTNLWAVRRGKAGRNGKLLVLAGHTDVVPTSPLDQWHSDPFIPTHRAGNL